jgi:hypothetical protein
VIKNNYIYPHFFIVGAQKSGTTWLWEMINQHPDAELPPKKEYHFFSKSYEYNNGLEKYLQIYEKISPLKVTGEASTSYLYDRVRKNVHMEQKNVEVDYNLPTIPELIIKNFPNIKIIIILRDPVKRAVSAYYHFIKAKNYSPMLKLGEVLEKYPNRLIVEYGLYYKYVQLWKKFSKNSNLRIYILEEDIKNNPKKMLKDVYSFLDLDQNFLPINYNHAIHERMKWTYLFLNYYNLRILAKIIERFKIEKITDRIAFKLLPKIEQTDVRALRDTYIHEKEKIEDLIGRSLDCWNYNYKHDL